jgi:imidazolonepropionase-like amidohydrolase
MSFCDHCQGQRFDRAQVLRALRAARQRLRTSPAECSADQTFALAIEAVRSLEIPHLEVLDDEVVDGEVVH